MCFISCHNHDSTSNFRLLDAIPSVEELIITANELNYKGLAITNHETVSSHLEAIQKVRELKKKGKIPQDFKLVLGNECYLLDDVEDTKLNYKSGVTKFPHFLILSKSKEGHEILRRLSSIAWKDNYFRTGFMERTPTDKKDLARLIKENPNQLIATSACLGSESSIRLLAIRDLEAEEKWDEAEEHRQKLDEFFIWCIDVFGKDNFFIELQPAISEEQRYVNSKLVPIADYYELKRIITTDTHYLRPEDRNIHKAFLNAKDGEREVDAFYADTYMHTIEEIYEKLEDYIDKDIIEDAIKNTLLIGEMVEEYTIEKDTIIPKIGLPEFELRHSFSKVYGQYEYINKMAHSPDEQDRYILKLIEDGFDEYIPQNVLTTEKVHRIMARINVELGELWELSQQLNQAMSSYYITVREIVEVIWKDDCGNSLVGSGRGSSGGFLICMLLGITQINPLEYGVEMPHWRHLHRSRPDISALDIDIDTESSKRPQIIQALKNRFGEDKIIQVATFGTMTSKSAIHTACRGLGFDLEVGQYLTSLIPFERGANYTLSECLYGDEKKDRYPIHEFIKELEKYPKLKETALKLEGKIDKRSVHAGGVVFFADEYYKSNALMRAPNGLVITQFNLNDCQSTGSIKFDVLTIEALDKIRSTLDLLLEHEEISWQGNLRKTFNHYLHPNVIEQDNHKIYEMLGSGKVMDLFQFSTDVGHQAATKVKPSNLIETASANSLMRLVASDGEQPIDTFVRFKNDIGVWYQEMKDWKLNDEEIELVKSFLLPVYGVADTQELVMLMSMSPKIAGFDVVWSGKLRKAIAKKSEEDMEIVREEFFKRGKELKNRNEILMYVWNVQIKRQLGYSFSILHTMAYSLIALQELNLNYHYNPLYWNTAVLSVNSGSYSDNSEDDEVDAKEQSRTTNYGKVASAISKVQKSGTEISLPNINKAHNGFTPDIENNKIIFGFKGVMGISDETSRIIKENRPFSSLDDFYKRMVLTKREVALNTGKIQNKSFVTDGQTIILIKSGAFDELESKSREEVLLNYLRTTNPPKKSITAKGIDQVIEMGIVPTEFESEIRFYNFKKYINDNPRIPDETLKSVKWHSMSNGVDSTTDYATNFFHEHFSSEMTEDKDYYYDEKGVLYVAFGTNRKGSFGEVYKEKMIKFDQWLKSEDCIGRYNKILFDEVKQNSMSGDISTWEMESMNYYYHDHELLKTNLDDHSVEDFDSISPEPEVIGFTNYKGVQFPKYKLFKIAGTVLDKDKNKHTVALLTPSGVVQLRLYAGQFTFYDRTISAEKEDGEGRMVLEDSWLKRNSKLIVSGFRRGDQFIAKRYRDSIFQHSLQKIVGITEDNSLVLQSERRREDEN